MSAIRLRGVRVHNLKNLDLEIPRNRLTVITGPSGSGKSSLAFDTLYAEGQRRYVESLSTYARQFLERVDRPDVDSIEGLPPAIAIQQKGAPTSGRSTVGTTTEIYDYLRLLFARIGRTYCTRCGEEVEEETVERVVDKLLAGADGPERRAVEALRPARLVRTTDAEGPIAGAGASLGGWSGAGLEGAEAAVHAPSESAGSDGTAGAGPETHDGLSRAERRLTIAFPVDPGKVLEAVSASEFLGDLRSNGFLRIIVDGSVRSIDEPASFDFTPRSRLSVVVDRLVLPAAESADAGRSGAQKPSRGVAAEAGTGVGHPGTTAEAASAVRRRLAEAVELAYRYGHGRLLAVEGDGTERRFSEDLHCARCDVDYRKPTPAFFSFNSPLGACPACQGFGRSIHLDPDRLIPDRTRTLGDGAVDPWNKPAYRGAYDDLRKAGRKHGLRWDVPYGRLPAGHRRLVEEGEGDWYGIRGFFEWLETKIYKVHVRVFLSRYRAYRTCAACGGARLRPEALAVRVGGADIGQVCRMNIGRCRSFFDALPLSPWEAAVCQRVLSEIRRRLRFLVEVGLDYLTLERMSRTLSGGEAQRINLAACLGSGLVGTLYVLDEPSIGLHPRDGDRLIRVVSELRDLGNTIVVVEHDEAMIRAGDRILDLGPAAGERGGEIVASGSAEEIARAAHSRTGAYLSRREAIAVPGRRRKPVRGRWLELLGARANNLKGLDARIPLGLLTCITGVSGSGKSSLVEETLYPALLRAKGREDEKAARQSGPYRELRGAERLNDVVMVDQSPIGKTPRSNPVTYIKAFDEIRKIFAAQRSSRAAGLAAGHFSFNVPGGRCDACDGQGVVTTEMQFLADIVLPCEACGGKRFKPEVLAARRGGRSIADVLDMTVDEAIRFFAGHGALVSRLEGLARTGLGYLRLGQPATTLSGGESQRLKLAAAMQGGRSGVMYLFDEPTTGLHVSDVAMLLACLERLVGADNTVLVVEHNMEVVKCSDWVIDIGPEGGAEGGTITVEGTPEDVARSRTHTGAYLARALDAA